MKFYILGLLKTLKSSLISALSIILAFLAPIGDLLVFITILVLMDFITGIVAAKYRGEVRTSNKMFNSYIKLVSYFGILLIGILFDEFAMKVFKTQMFDHILSFFLSGESIETLFKFKLVALVSFIIVVREFKSIDENWYTIRGWSFISTTVIIFEKIKTISNLILELKNQFKK